MQGEIFLDQDPYIVVQPGYSHAWNAHGGSAHLHEHLVTHYAACWQQSLSNGEWDPSVCDIGVSRLFNYYVEGLWWSITQPPYINGVYYDGVDKGHRFRSSTLCHFILLRPCRHKLSTHWYAAHSARR